MPSDFIPDKLAVYYLLLYPFTDPLRQRERFTFAARLAKRSL